MLKPANRSLNKSAGEPVMCNPDFAKKIASGVGEALSEACELPMMLTALRNGGSESLLRALVNHRIEKATNCVAFTEQANKKKRADLKLIDSRSGTPAAFVEFKHNFVNQARGIANEMEKARQQLISQRSGNEEEVAAALGSSAIVRSTPPRSEAIYVYVHFLVSLDYGDKLSSDLAAIHNQNLGEKGGYKLFFDRKKANEKIAKAINTAIEAVRDTRPDLKKEQGEAGKYFFRHALGDAGAQCTLICWAFALEGPSFVPLQLMP
ncbi:hypothetical protein [Silanimonas sp.]|uniref:hypothetical protein n=1 Tax=Silanimonas sp. TaxID=1929290 RepID=UPI0022CA66EB|nr:hypothetical protein [Silanimonas sp.]MCZ8167190.1 hypothetical protein [Silanimonas sp.]